MLSVKKGKKDTGEHMPKVYLSGFPSDLAQSLEILADELQNAARCDIYYESSATNLTLPDDLKTYLADMQLLVIPVTVQYLRKDSQARLFEYSYAMEHHIPVLPIIMESAAAPLFSDVMNAVRPGYGDIQYLDRTSQDPTEIPYTEKLKQRMSDVLIGNELAERIRAAFDAYVFLSYRKKDRAIARELMHLIHHIPYCRDIAIWYDEYLIPGERWNDAIAEAMAKSVLMLLAVTPSVVEPGNYVASQEYPHARRTGKDIIATELVPTDLQTLHNLFPELGDLINGHDVNALAKALSPMLRHIAIKGNDSPEHNYLIGLAYLGAIDVERDPDIAVPLITDAAEHELTDAMDQLARMYHMGNGMKRDLLMAIEWRQRLTDKLYDDFSASGRQPDWLRWALSCIDMYRYLEELLECGPENTDTEGIRQTMCIVLGPVIDSCPGELLHVRKFALELLGRSYFHSGNDQMAERCFTESGASPLLLGDIKKKRGDLPGAKQSYETALAQAESSGKEWETAKCCEHLADICQRLGEENRACELYKRALSIRLDIAGDSPAADHIEDLAAVRYRLGTMQNAQNAVDEISEALRLYRQLHQSFPDNKRYTHNMDLAAQALAETQKKEDNTVNKLTGMAEETFAKGISLKSSGNLTEARKMFLKTAQFYEQAFQKSRDPGILVEAATGYIMAAMADTSAADWTQLCHARKIISTLRMERSFNDPAQLTKMLTDIDTALLGMADSGLCPRQPAEPEIWKKYGRCRYCGGNFKGVFTKKCADCGKNKDY